MKTADAVMDNFQASFPRAKLFMAPLALLASVSGFLGRIVKYHDISYYTMIIRTLL